MDYPHKIKLLNTNEILIQGETVTPPGLNDEDAFLLKTNANGDMIWFKSYGTPKDDISTSVLVSHDNFYYVTGYSSLGLTDPPRTFLFKTDTAGVLSNFISYGKICGFCLGENLIENIDSSIVIAGSQNPGNSNISIIKADLNCLTSCDDSFPPIVTGNLFPMVNTGITIDSGGTSVDVTSSLMVTSVLLTENTICSSTGFEEINSSHLNLQLFPNPTTGTIQLTFNTKHNAPLKCEIINVMGEMVYEAPLPASPRRGEEGYATLDVSFLAKGIYVMRAGDEKSWENKKLVVE